jgi:hypothetical protein
MTERKTCTACGLEKPISEFHRQASAKGGIRPHCKACGNAKKRELRKRAAKNAQATTRVCEVCGVEKPLEQFRLQGDGYKYRRKECRGCERDRRREREMAQRLALIESGKAKRCTTCGRVKPLEGFRPHSGKPDGRATECKMCQRRRDRDRERRRKSRDRSAFLAEIKQCQICRQEKPKAEFRLCAHSVDGCLDYCRSCGIHGKRPTCTIEAETPEQLRAWEQRAQKRNQPAIDILRAQTQAALEGRSL